MATGRSDIKNQINNVLAFGIRGAIDVRATDINDAAKIAAAHSSRIWSRPKSSAPTTSSRPRRIDVAPAVPLPRRGPPSKAASPVIVDPQSWRKTSATCHQPA